jgi:hypothetical protein
MSYEICISEIKPRNFVPKSGMQKEEKERENFSSGKFEES